MVKERIKDFAEGLCSVRKIIALSVTGVFCYLSITGKIGSNEFIPVFSMIIGYYFGKSTALELPNHSHKDQGTDSTVDYTSYPSK